MNGLKSLHSSFFVLTDYKVIRYYLLTTDN